VHKVKELTEERERFSLDFKEENQELQNKINALEREIEYLNGELERQETAMANSSNSGRHNRRKSDASASDG
jgi:predicted RNase H-like nuclease (RuvC/YqgF family)